MTDQPKNHWDIIEDYRWVLAKTSHPALMGVPEKILPHTKCVIQESIKQALALECVKPQRDPGRIEALQKDYITLAQFIPYESFGLKTSDYDQGIAVFLQNATPAQRAVSLKITRAIRREEDVLKQDIEKWCQGFRL